MAKTFWDAVYTNIPIDNIPWQLAQADWFSELLTSKTLKGKSALDSGCGTGTKTIQLAQAGFERVVGIDIAEKAISYALANAEKAHISDKVSFVTGDVTGSTALGDETFDFVLDWATLHCLELEERPAYIDNILAHTHEGSHLLLRVFANADHSSDDYFVDTVAGESTKIYLFDIDAVTELFEKHFEIVRTNRSRARTKTGRTFNEYLLRRRPE